MLNIKSITVRQRSNRIICEYNGKIWKFIVNLVDKKLFTINDDIVF